jgi:hypothetical protein
MKEVQVDLIKFADLTIWAPKLGDVIFRDGIFSRWFAVVCGVDKDLLLVRKAGNIRLLVMNDYEEVKLNVRKIKNSMIGSYNVISSDGVYYA